MEQVNDVCEFPAELVERCVVALVELSENPKVTWEESVLGVLRESGHAELVEALAKSRQRHAELVEALAGLLRSPQSIKAEYAARRALRKACAL